MPPVRRASLTAALVLVAGGLVAVTGSPLLLGIAMVSPALALALALCWGWYPGLRQIERLQERRRGMRTRVRRPVSVRPSLRPSPFRAPNGPLLGISLAVRPPPA